MQRVVFPVSDIPDVAALYVEDVLPEFLTRLSVRIRPGELLRLCSYFNAFPASYWRRWTAVDTVRLSIRLDRAADISVWCSDAQGRARRVDSRLAAEVDLDLPIGDQFEAGGLYWFELRAPESQQVSLLEAWWSVVGANDGAGTASIGITTFNRPAYCLDQLRRIAGERALQPSLDRVYVVDQGTDLVSAQPGFAQVAEQLGSHLSLIRQANLGGSGGFSRAMVETLEAGDSTYLLLLDDDAISEPESILRAIRFADFTTSATLIGGAMFHLDNRHVRYTQGEAIDFGSGLARPLPGVPYDTDFVTEPLRTQNHQRCDATFNGWWMTLIPTEVLRELGLSLPYFIKWDDLEYALRCARAGVPTVSLPGVAVWHQAWHNKFSWRNWETYFTERNMYLSLISHQDRPRRIPLRSFLADVGMILSLQYSSVALRIAGRSDALRGLDILHAELGTRRAAVQQFRARFRDTDKRPEAAGFPPVSGPTPSHTSTEPEIHSFADIALALRVALRQLLVPPRRLALRAPAAELGAHEAIWRQFGALDSALVRYPDGYVWLVRDQGLAWRLLLGSLRSCLLVGRRWLQLHRMSDAGLAAAASQQAWQRTFAASPSVTSDGGDS